MVGQTGGTKGCSRWYSSFRPPVGDRTNDHPPGNFSERSITVHPSSEA